MSAQQRNPFQDWLDQSVGDRPRSRFAQFSEPIQIGDLDIASGQITASDHWVLDPAETGGAFSVKPGRYRAMAIGADFGGHRRVAGVSLLHSDADRDQLRFTQVGELGIASWGAVFGDYLAWFDNLKPAQQQQLCDKQFGTYPDGCELFRLMVEESGITVLRCFTGLGSGVYPIDAIWDRSGCVGIQCQFILDQF